MACVIRYDQWKRGYATEATALLIRFEMGTLRLHRLWTSHGPENPSSGRVPLKARMFYKGGLRHNVIDKGAWCDSLVYGIIPEGPHPGSNPWSLTALLADLGPATGIRPRRTTAPRPGAGGVGGA